MIIDYKHILYIKKLKILLFINCIKCSSIKPTKYKNMQGTYMGYRTTNNVTQRSIIKAARDAENAKKAKEVKDAKKTEEAKKTKKAIEAKRTKYIDYIYRRVERLGIFHDSNNILNNISIELDKKIPDSDIFFGLLLFTIESILCKMSITDDKNKLIKIIKILTSYENIPLNIDDAVEPIHIIVSKLFSNLDTDIDPKTQKIGGDIDPRYNQVVRYKTCKNEKTIAIFSKCAMPYSIMAGSIEYGEGATYFKTTTELIIHLYTALQWLRNQK